MAIMLVEQAVLSCILGPRKLKYQLNLLAKIDGEVPVAELVGPSSGSFAFILT